MIRKKEDNSVRNGSLEAGAGAYAGKKLFDGGYIDGRNTLYHGTSTSAADRIRKVGLQAKYTGKGSSEAKQILNVLPEDLIEKSKGHTFLTSKRATAAEYAAQHGKSGRSVAPSLGLYNRFFKNYVGIDKGVVKSRVPLYNRKVISNPEGRGSFGEWQRKKPIIGMVAPTDLQQKAIHNSLMESKVVKGSIARKYIKGNNYKGPNLKEYAKFLKKRKGKAALGIAGGLAAAGAIGDGIRRMTKKKEG